jgi:ribonuclease P protein component
MERLKRRRDFVAAAKALTASARGFAVQARERNDGGAPRVGFTATRKLGNAVTRNRIRRRLRELARLHLARGARPGFDYVLIARPPALNRSFSDLALDLDAALRRLHRRPAADGNPT